MSPGIPSTSPVRPPEQSVSQARIVARWVICVLGNLLGTGHVMVNKRERALPSWSMLTSGRD